MNHALSDQPSLTLAAVDLGSNSFRLEIAQCDHGQIVRREYLKETVRQGSGLDANHCLTREAMQRGWDCLWRFGQRLRGFSPAQVRAVATQTLREARNREVFLERAVQLLGFPIEVISGEEEARLIYRGVCSQLPSSHEQRLVIDIGGRSTELVMGSGHAVQAAHSYRIGSVSWSVRYFPDGFITPEALHMAHIAAAAVLDEVLDTFAVGGWQQVYASAGTANAVGEVLAANGITPGRITREGLQWLQAQLLRAGHVDRVRIAGLKEDRRPVIAGGLSVLQAVFDVLQLQELTVAQGALRMGVLHGMAQGLLPEGDDVQLASVQALMRRFRVDATQARHVRDVAQELWLQLFEKHDAPHCPAALQHAALLHEVGQCIDHDDFHRHGAYIVGHSPMAGLSWAERQEIANLILGHRGKLKKMQPWLEGAEPEMVAALLCLRLASVLCCARQNPDVQGVQLHQPSSKQLLLRAPEGWSQRCPLAARLLQDEAMAMEKIGLKLNLALG